MGLKPPTSVGNVWDLYPRLHVGWMVVLDGSIGRGGWWQVEAVGPGIQYERCKCRV